MNKILIAGFLTFSCLLFLTPSQLFGQGSTENKNNVYRWSLSINTGINTTEVAGDIEKAMINADFDYMIPPSRPGPGQKHPYSETGLGDYGFPWTINADYLIGDVIKIGVLMSNTMIGGTTGRHFDPNVSLEMKYTVLTLSPLILLQVHDMISIGLGPALFINHTGQIRERDESTIDRVKHLGILSEVKIVYPQQTRLFLELTGHYRYMGTSEIDPFQIEHTGGTLTFPSFESNFSHFYLGLGFGIRL